MAGKPLAFPQWGPPQAKPASAAAFLKFPSSPSFFYPPPFRSGIWVSLPPSPPLLLSPFSGIRGSIVQDAGSMGRSDTQAENSLWLGVFVRRGKCGVGQGQLVPPDSMELFLNPEVNMSLSFLLKLIAHSSIHLIYSREFY